METNKSWWLLGPVGPPFHQWAIKPELDGELRAFEQVVPCSRYFSVAFVG
jgi:hypothetical protein